jgi:UDP-N-acetylmuramoyl-tripeptide--D-alanyl-D-alanine ligase
LKGSQSPKSFNNDIGVPLTILGVSPSDHYVVLELGTNHPGELSPLSLIARPDIAIITSIGPEHLEGFKDLTGVRREEAALLDGLAPHGLAIVNGDDKPLLKLIRHRVPRLITFGFNADNDVAIASVECSLEETRFTLRGGQMQFQLPMPGRHNASNALAAILAGREFGLDDATIRHALATCSRPEMRMQLTRVGNVTILNDAYNANPASMEAALLTIAEANVPGRRIAVLGEMREMGDSSDAMHRRIGQLAATSKIDLLVCVGEAARPLADAAVVAGMPQGRIHLVTDSQTAAQFLPSILLDGDTLLLKASRGVKLERVIESLTKAN